MSKKTPSVDLNFEIVFDKEKETSVQKIKRWIKKQKSPLDIVLLYFFSYFEKWYFDYKVKRTMSEIDAQVKYIGSTWDEEDKKNQEPIIESKPSEVEGLDDIRISNPAIPDPWDGDWNDYYAASNKINKESDHE